MKEEELKVCRKYSFWKHPFRYFKDRKAIKFINWYVNYQWNNGLKEEVEKGELDLLMYGGAVMKDGKHIDYKEFIKNTKL